MTRRLKKIILIVVIFFAVYTLFGFFVLPHIVKSILVKQLSNALHREVTIYTIRTNPYKLTLTVRGFVVKGRTSPETMVSCRELYLNLQILSALKKGLILREIRIEQPYINVVRHEDLSYSFSDLIKGEKGSDSKPFRVSLNNIQIINGTIVFWDIPKHKRHTATDINVAIPFLSNFPYYVDIFVQPSFSATVNETPFSLQGQTKPFADSLETTFDVEIKDLDIPYYLPYIPLQMNFRVLSGSIDVKAKILYVQFRDKEPTFTVTGDVALNGIEVVDREGAPVCKLPLIAIRETEVDLTGKELTVGEFLTKNGVLVVQRFSDGDLNLQKLVPRSSSPAEKSSPSSGEQSGKPWVITLKNVVAEQYTVKAEDQVPSQPVTMIAEGIKLKAEGISTAKDSTGKVSLSFLLNRKGAISAQGSMGINPVSAKLDMDLKDIVIGQFQSYFTDKVNIKVPSGSIDAEATVSYVQFRDREPTFTIIGGVALKGIEVVDREGASVCKLPLIAIKQTEVDLTGKKLTVGEFLTKNGVLVVRRFSDGNLNLERLFSSSSSSAEKSSRSSSEQSGKPWVITLKNVVAEQYTVKAEDQVPVQPVTMIVERIKLKAEGISTAKNSTGKVSLSFRLNKKGAISARGSMGINPVSAKLDMDLKDIIIGQFQSYFTEKVKITVTEGDISTSGNLVLARSEDKGVTVRFRGKASVNNFASTDRVNMDDFVKWKSLSLTALDVGYNPTYVQTDEIALIDFYSRVIINPNGTLNLQAIMEDTGSETEALQPTETQEKEIDRQATKEQGMRITIEKVRFKGGHINFTDRSVKPNYSANLVDFGGAISGLSSEETKLADVDLTAKLDQYAPLAITGKINPLRDDLYVDLNVTFSGIELSPFTPYSGKYIGYTTQMGKLSLDLNYKIVKKKLDSQNKFFFDQFALGDKVESPDAIKLPIKLAISLLKDRKGEIKLDIPITGSIDDPKFSVFGIIIKIIMNLIAKAATSPFALMGAAFGGGEQLTYVEFDPGTYIINEQGEKKLSTLIKALYERPGLRLEVEGHVDTEKDRQGLRQYFFNKKLKAQKLKHMVKKGLTAVPVDEVTIEPNEYERYLRKAYKAEKFPKPKNIIGIPKKLPPPEMEKLMFAHIEAKDDDLRQLALQRAAKVKDYILRSGQIEPQRIFLIEPRSLSPEKKEKLKDSRVDFRLK